MTVSVRSVHSLASLDSAKQTDPDSGKPLIHPSANLNHNTTLSLALGLVPHLVPYNPTERQT